MEESGDPIVQKLLWTLMRFKKLERHHRTFAGLTFSEIRVLFIIRESARHHGRETKVSEISRALGVTSPTITQTLKELETKGLVERHVDQADRRFVGIALTDKGMEVTRQACEARMVELRELVDYLGEEQSVQFVDLIDKVASFFQQKMSSESNQVWNGD